MLGPYGWEPMVTAFLEDGIYRAASKDHYTTGTYKLSGDQLEMSAVSVRHGEERTLFGKKTKEMYLEFKGNVEEGKIKGQTRDSDGTYQVAFRAFRLADLS